MKINIKNASVHYVDGVKKYFDLVIDSGGNKYYINTYRECATNLENLLGCTMDGLIDELVKKHNGVLITSHESIAKRVFFPTRQHAKQAKETVEMFLLPYKLRGQL